MRLLTLAGFLCFAAQQNCWAQPVPTKPEPERDVVVVVGMAPLDTGVEIERVPGAATHLDAADLARTGSPDLLEALGRRVGGVSLSLAQGSSFQPNVLYRGFEASPLQGNAQGVAVYVDGARFNQPFGDTMDWDLIPDIAIAQADLVSSNPAFGLNALGGALNVQFKTALGAEGASVEVSGGSFGRTSLAAQASGQAGPFAFYGAVSALDENGWRDFSPSRLRQGYLDLGWKQDRLDLHLSLLSANNDLTGNGVSPVELLDTDRSAVFTHPDSTQNDFNRLLLGGDWRPDDRWTIRLRAYAGHLDRKTENGDAAEVAPCVEDPDVLCSTETDATLTDDVGEPIPNFVVGSPYVDSFPIFAAGGPYAFLNASRTRTTSSGVSIQAIGMETMLGVPHRLSAGVSFDGARTRFNAGTRIGALKVDRGFEGSGVAVDQPDASITPVSVNVRTKNWGVFASDAMDLTPDLTLTLMGRQNIADVRLRDQLGIALDGDHVFRRFNPAAGLTWRVQEGITVYGGYAETNRAPTPAELSCADPESPCSLANFFVADPPLRQVIARTWEAGLRGHIRAIAAVDLDWRLGSYRTTVNDDIQLVASGVAGRGYFTNVGNTQREGLEASLVARTGELDLFAEYAFTQATYRTSFDLNAGANPAFDDEDDIMTIEAGDHRPGIPEHTLKMGADLALLPSFSIGVDGIWSSGRFLFGDEANLNPRSSDYFVLNVHAISRFGERTEIFLQVQNLFDADYATFGAFAPIDVVPILGLPDLSDPRSLSPGAPRAVFVGLRFRL